MKDLLEPGVLFESALFQDLVRSDQLELAPGARLGVFKLVREIGRGGMGVVWLAERDDGEYRQQVAIKCVLDPSASTGAELFRHERQILAELRHASIARLLEGGRREDGLLWFAMELIDGPPIDRHARDAALTLDARLRMFLSTLDAIGVAHARLVIHRDLKPSNVLVDADGRAKLLDFGIAALAGDAAAARAYSPGWASPEQRSGGNVGTASDQFQLGLLLDAVLRRADCPAAPPPGGEPVDPARWMTMPRHRQRELEAVLARACAIAPEARYRSVAELAHELERMLEHRPVAALAHRALYPLACALRRRPGMFAASAAALLLATLMVGAFTWRLARERDISRNEAATTQAINRFLNEDLLAAADPYGENLKDVPIGEVVERAVPRVAARLSTQPAVAGAVYRTLGDMLANLGRVEPARATLDRAVEALTRAHGAIDARTVEARILRAGVDEFAGRYGDYAQQLRGLRAELDALDRRDARLIEVDRRIAWGEYELGNYARADAAYVDLLERCVGNAAVADVDRAMMYGGHSLALNRLGRSAEALDAARLGHAIRVRELGPDHPETQQSLLHIANALVGLERLAEAVDAYAELHRKASARFGPMHTETLVIAHELGVALMRAAQPARAVPYLEQAVAAKVAALGAAAGSTMNSASWLALAYLRAGRIEDAERTFDRVAAFVSANDFERRAEIGLRRNIGELRLAQGRAAAALASCASGATIAAGFLDAAHPLRATVDACRGVALVELGREQEGRALLQSVHAALEASGSQGSAWNDTTRRILEQPSHRAR